MQILDRVATNVNICGIEIAFAGNAVPSTIDGWQPFYNSTFQGTSWEKAYAGMASLEFSEESDDTAAGTKYLQKIIFRFPNSDESRAKRIALLRTLKFIKLKFTNGLHLVVGRNDFFQNTLPAIKVKTNEQLCEVEVSAESIFPSGYTPNPDAYGLPSFVPLTLM